MADNRLNPKINVTRFGETLPLKLDRASIIRMKNGFAYIKFYNQNSGKSTNGWIKLTDFEIEEEGGC